VISKIQTQEILHCDIEDTEKRLHCDIEDTDSGDIAL
jgi:hypothetical protein